jgi:hypothetical protein
MVKKYILISHILILFLILLLINLSFNHVFDNHFPMKIKESNLEKFTIENKNITLFVGDSHTNSGIYPKYISKNSYNFGNGGESYIEIYYHILDLIQKNASIANVILEIDSSMLLKNAETRFENRLYYYKDKIGIKSISNILDKNILSTWLNLNFGFIGRGEFFGLTLLDVSLGSDGAPKNSNTTMDISYFDGKKNLISVDNLSYFYFNEILNLVKINNLKIIFINYPASFYAENLIETESLDKHYNLINKSILNYIGTPLILDYRYLFYNETDKFTDGVHLNDLGATEFSKFLVKDLKELNLIE